MLKLRNLLLQDRLYLSLITLVIIITGMRILFEPNHTTTDIILPVTARISNYYIEDNQLNITLSRVHIKATYYIKTPMEKKCLEEKIKIGDIYEIYGEISTPQKPTSKGLFNYKNYLKTKNIYYLLKIQNIKKVSISNNPFYKLKNILKKRIGNNPYLNTFILGDKTYINDNVIKSYQENGISHLFAISGMHISLLSTIILRILKSLKIQEQKRYYIASLFLLLYLLLVGLSPSVLRGVIFFYLFSINNIYYFYIKNTNIFMVALSITLLINPFFIYDIGFLYSFSISFALLISSNYLKSKNYFIGLLKTSYISFISSLPDRKSVV